MEYAYPTAFAVWGDAEKEAIDTVISSGKFTMGMQVARFESEFAHYHDKKHAVMVNSGSSANLLAIAALFNKAENPLKRGDKVLVPALAWSTTYAPLVQHGLELVLADCDGSWNVDPYARDLDLLDVRLVVGCSILGNPAPLADLATAAGVLGAYFIEDNCESLGASIGGRLCGSFGMMSTFSFFWSHQLSAIEGGMVLTDDDELAVLLRMLRAHGWTRDVRDPYTPVEFDREYDFRVFGYNVRPLEMHAAIGRVQLAKVDVGRVQRKANLAAFAEAVEFAVALQEERGDPNPFGIAFTVLEGRKRDALAFALRSAGVDCRMPTGGSFLMHHYGQRWRAQRTPSADFIHERGLFLGNGPVDLTSQIATAVTVIREMAQ